MLLKRMLEIQAHRHYNNSFRIRTTYKFLCRLVYNRLKDGEFFHQGKSRTIRV